MFNEFGVVENSYSVRKIENVQIDWKNFTTVLAVVARDDPWSAGDGD